MTEQDVFNLVGDALVIPRGQIHRGSSSQDISEWDSMGILGILTALNGCGVRVEPADVDKLQSIEGILAEVRKAGKLD
jgi:acyl carrier protein